MLIVGLPVNWSFLLLLHVQGAIFKLPRRLPRGFFTLNLSCVVIKLPSLKRQATDAAISFWFALEMHHNSAIGAKFTFAGKYYAALTNLAYLTRDLHFRLPRTVFSCWMMVNLLLLFRIRVRGAKVGEKIAQRPVMKPEKHVRPAKSVSVNCSSTVHFLQFLMVERSSPCIVYKEI